MSGVPVADLDWDSEFFGFAIARVTSHALTAQEIDGVLAECRRRGVRCLYLLTGDERTSLLAQDRGFRLHDVRVELDRSLDGHASTRTQFTVAAARPDQRRALAAWARERFTDSRFFADPGFDDDRARDLFAAFVDRGFDAHDRRTLADADGRGFVICRLQPERAVGRIELIGVAPGAEGSGLADALMHAAHDEFVAAGLQRAEVVTQARNIAAQRLYQRLGYRSRRSALWFHRWFD